MVTLSDPWIEAILSQTTIAGRFTDLRVMADPYKGHFSYVFDALDLDSRRRVALKFLRPERMREPRCVEYFKREGVISLALAQHPQFVHLVAPPSTHVVEMTLATGVAVEFPLSYLATERAVADFDQFLFGHRRKRASVWRRLEVVRDVVKGVAKLHRLGYTHRDLKPDNIFLYPGGGAKLGDLGLCRQLDDSEHLRGNYDQPVGHRLYAAPEAFCGAAANAELQTRADWFAVGAILFEAVSGLKLYAAIGLSQPIQLVGLFSRFGPLERFEEVVGDISGRYPLPNVEDHVAPSLLSQHSPRTWHAISGLVADLCHFDHRRRLCVFERILGRLDLAMMQAKHDSSRRRRAPQQTLAIRGGCTANRAVRP